jgi:hypothetical protein
VISPDRAAPHSRRVAIGVLGALALLSDGIVNAITRVAGFIG